MHLTKIFGCNIHHTIRVSQLALKIIDTPEFQRMRYIKQLGICDYVFPAACHSRFEHSLGVYHLAGLMVEKIQHNYPHIEYDLEFIGKTKLNKKIGECIKIAALCHDIGHGPYSHIFDNVLLKKSTHVNKDHETRSCLIVDLICKRELRAELDDNHIEFIKSIINPKAHHTGALYQIVSNNLNGIDVDKFDYLTRDTSNLNMDYKFDPQRLINNFIIDPNGNIAYNKHCSHDIYNMYHTRYMMHKTVYNHKTVKLLETMLEDIFLKLDAVFNISNSISDMNVFCKLVDSSIFDYIKYYINPLPFIDNKLSASQMNNIVHANNIYQNIQTRKLYKRVVHLQHSDTINEAYLNEFIEYITNTYPSKIKKKYLKIIKISIGYLNKDIDPFNTIFFYDKNLSVFKLDRKYISALMSNSTLEISYILVCKRINIFKFVSDTYAEYESIKKIDS